MSENASEWLELEQAIEILIDNAPIVDDVEHIRLNAALGRIAARDINARLDNPPFDRSPLDGYALNSAFTVEPPNDFTIVGEECAGDFFDRVLGERQALRIMTGAPMPRGSDCVVRQEDVTVEGDRLTVPYTLNHRQNYCFKGEDVHRGALLIARNTPLKAAHIGVLAAQGIAAVEVYRRPSIVIASTGDELVDIDRPLVDGKIYNSNLYMLNARLIELGFDPIVVGIWNDDADSIVDEIKRRQCDLLITTGGVSVGKKDIMHEVVKKLGAEKLFWRVAMKPGAPALAYKFEGMLGLALSGNPFAAFATFELMSRPLLAKLSRRENVMYRRLRAELADDFNKASRGRRFIRSRLSDGRITLSNNHASGSLASMMNCNAFVDIPAGTERLSAGMTVDVIEL
ncbi:MAG: molybdopterin molybdotransferase MoeA [Selenomonadaceae bacterium]|nr:molybdopterin molybdotransferase MoeA [Selenomonadaceae bacterium]